MAVDVSWKALETEIRAAAAKHGLSIALVAAIVETESSGETYAVRYEPTFSYLYQPSVIGGKLGVTLATEMTCQKISWGPMQVMGAVARQFGFEALLSGLTRPEIGLEYGCRLLAQLQTRYSAVEDVISAYNQGSAKRGPSGAYLNQGYVDKVKVHMAEIAGETLQ